MQPASKVAPGIELALLYKKEEYSHRNLWNVLIKGMTKNSCNRMKIKECLKHYETASFQEKKMYEAFTTGKPLKGMHLSMCKPPSNTNIVSTKIIEIKPKYKNTTRIRPIPRNFTPTSKAQSDKKFESIKSMASTRVNNTESSPTKTKL